jgi:hypothetical protein
MYRLKGHAQNMKDRDIDKELYSKQEPLDEIVTQKVDRDY